jgi:acetate kinase
MNLLVPNLGSTSLKYQVLEMPDERVVARGRVERVENYHAAIAEIRTGGGAIDAVAFKAVHAGPDYRGTYRLDAALLEAMERYLPAAPVHNRIYIDAMRAFAESLPGVPLVAAFETEFHRTMPAAARTYGVPADWRAAGIEHYGFHGASHEFISRRAPEFLGRPVGGLRLVSCHLGGSSSICAIDSGRSVDTTMGFSPQSGLENATRHGDLDVFAVLFMMERRGWTAAQVREQLARLSGLAGLSGVAGGDARDIQAAAAAGSADAALALEVFSYQVRKTIGAYAAALGGLDAVAFTGGIGENSAELRAACCEGLEFLGISIDPVANTAGGGDRLVSHHGAPVAVLALATNEELVVARRVWRVLSP